MSRLGFPFQDQPRLLSFHSSRCRYEELVSLKEGLAETDAKRWLEWLPTEQALATDDDMKSDNYSGSAMDVDGPLNMGYGSKASDDEVPVPEDPTKLFEDALKNLAEAIKSGDGPGSQHLLSTILDNDTLVSNHGSRRTYFSQANPITFASRLPPTLRYNHLSLFCSAA
jgi:hypothetical protein